jgi:hypothetical protein
LEDETERAPKGLTNFVQGLISAGKT